MANTGCASVSFIVVFLIVSIDEVSDELSDTQTVFWLSMGWNQLGYFLEEFVATFTVLAKSLVNQLAHLLDILKLPLVLEQLLLCVETTPVRRDSVRYLVQFFLVARESLHLLLKTLNVLLRLLLKLQEVHIRPANSPWLLLPLLLLLLLDSLILLHGHVDGGSLSLQTCHHIGLQGFLLVHHLLLSPVHHGLVDVRA